MDAKMVDNKEKIVVPLLPVEVGEVILTPSGELLEIIELVDETENAYRVRKMDLYN